MGKILETIINKFDGGMARDPRDKREDVCNIIQHFDNYSYPSKLLPHRDFEVDGSPESIFDGYRITQFTEVNNVLYGVGQVSAADNHTQLYKRSDPTALNWSSVTGGTHASSVESKVFLLGYKNYLYGVNSGGVWKFNISGASFTYNDYTTNVPTAPGLVFSKDDIMYIPSNNLLLKNTDIAGTGWSVALTFPTNSQIVDLCEYGNYLAIAVNQTDGKSIVYLWDRDSSLTTLSEKIEWGNMSIALIENIGGILVGISKSSLSITSASPYKLTFKYWTGTRIVTFQEFDCTSFPTVLEKQKFNDLFYFLGVARTKNTSGGTAGVTSILAGLWKIFKKSDGTMTVSFDRFFRGDTQVAPSDDNHLKGFYRWGDIVYAAYINPADSKYTIWRSSASHGDTSIYESQIFNTGDSSITKKLLGVTIMTEPLAETSSVTLKYRINAETSWTTIFTEGTDNSISHSAVNIESSGATLPEYKEIQFRIESDLGAVITGLKFKEEIIDKDKY